MTREGLLNRLRRSERGAAMAEFVLLTPVIILMWMGIEHFRSGYARRLDAIARSQTAAWSRAYSNDMSCYRGAIDFSGVAGFGADIAGGGDKANQAITDFQGNTNSSSMFLYAEAGSTQTQSTKRAGWDKTVGQVSGKTLVLCNEVVPSRTNDQNVITPLKSFITGVFSF